MSDFSKEISSLLETSNMPAPDVTHPLKIIGDGNMQEGVKKLYNFGYMDGKISERKKCGIALGVVTAAWGLSIGIPFVKKKVTEIKEHKKEGEEIISALKEGADEDNKTTEAMPSE